MLKMLLDPMGGILLTNDGNAILREVEVAHPAAKSMIELSRTQDEEVGDGTTSVIVLGRSDLLAYIKRKQIGEEGRWEMYCIYSVYYNNVIGANKGQRSGKVERKRRVQLRRKWIHHIY